MPDALGMLAVPRLMLPHLLSVFLFATISRAERSTGAFRDTAESRGVGAAGSSSSRTAMWTAWPVVDDVSSHGSRCAAVCGVAPDRRRRGDDSREALEECGVDLEFSGFVEGARVVGVELDLGLAIAPDSLRVYGLDEGLDIEYNVFQQQR